VINAIVHGNKMDPTRKVEVSLQARPRSIQARVRDQGAGFDAGSTPDPTVGDNVLRSSGRGLLVMRAFVDSVDFKFREGRGMEVTLKKTRGGRSTASSTRPSAAAADNGGSER
jgi:serine/threonine-protein kinase RsbW